MLISEVMSVDIDCIWFHLCVLTYYCRSGAAPSNLADIICQVANIEGRCHLCSLVMTALIVPPITPLAFGDRAFRRHSMAMEQSAISHLSWTVVTYYLPMRTEDISVLFELC